LATISADDQKTGKVAAVESAVAAPDNVRETWSSFSSCM